MMTSQYRYRKTAKYRLIMYSYRIGLEKLLSALNVLPQTPLLPERGRRLERAKQNVGHELFESLQNRQGVEILALLVVV